MQDNPEGIEMSIRNSFIESIRVLAESDIVIGGGGPAGVAAALAAARTGNSVVLLEQTGSLGGMAAVGLVPCMASLSDGINNVAAGICTEIVHEVCRRMGIKKVMSLWQPIDAETFKQVCDEKIRDAGVKVYFAQKIVAVECPCGSITAVAAGGPQGLKQVRGKVFIDTTGDAAMTAFAGGNFVIGDSSGKTMSPSLCVQYAGINWTKYYNSAAHGRSARRIWLELLESGLAPLEEHHFIGIWETGATTGTGNLGHIYGVNAVQENDLTKGYFEGRRIARIIHDFFRKHVPGFEKSELVNTASLLSVRETRRIVGDYILSFDDYLKRNKFPDEISRYCYPIDIHSSSLDAKEQKAVEQRLEDTRYRPGENYGIPYRTLLPLGIDNLLVAGRSISCDREMQSSIRVMPSCFLTGQAAGVAAALSLECNGRTRDIDTNQLRTLLKKDYSAYLPEL